MASDLQRKLGLRLGKQPAHRPAGLKDFSAYLKTAFPATPDAVAVPNAQYPMDGNDQWGDCVMACDAHFIAAWDAETGSTDAVPTDAQVIAEYQSLTGAQQPGDANDTGLVISNVLQLWQSSGLWGSVISAYAPVILNGDTELQDAIAFYGGVAFGIQCPESALQQFNAGEPWTVVNGSPIDGGHCILGLGYSSAGALCATWGGIAVVTWAFLAKYADEAWAVIPPQFSQTDKTPGSLDLAQLQSDLSQLNQVAPSPAPTPAPPKPHHKRPWWEFW